MQNDNETENLGIRMKFIDTVLSIRRERTSIEGAIAEAEQIFTKAGLVLDSFKSDASHTSYTNKGRPPRGAMVLLMEKFNAEGGGWVPASWSEARRLARVTSRQEIEGRYDHRNRKHLPCFNVRRMTASGGFSYSLLRLYVHDEGITWRWAD